MVLKAQLTISGDTPCLGFIFPVRAENSYKHIFVFQGAKPWRGHQEVQDDSYHSKEVPVHLARKQTSAVSVITKPPPVVTEDSEGHKWCWYNTGGPTPLPGC